MAMTKSECGKLGGLALKERYGREVFIVMGRLGGRPRSLTIEQIRNQQALETEKNNAGGNGYPSRNLLKLKRLWRIRQKSNC